MTDVYRDVSLPAGVRKGVDMAAEAKVVCGHRWVNAEGLDCQICKHCGAYSALSVIKIPLHRDVALAEEIVSAADQYALAYNVAVDMSIAALPGAVGQALIECEDWQRRKKIDEYYPVKKNIKRWMPSREDLWECLTVLRNTDARFRGLQGVHRSGMGAGLNAVLAAYDRYAKAHNAVFYVKQHNRKATEKNKHLLAEYEKQKAASPDKKIAKPELVKLERVKKSDLAAVNKGIYETKRLFLTKKNRTKKPITLPLLETAKYRPEDNSFKLEGVTTRLRAKRRLPEGLDIRNGVIVETTSFVNKNTQPHQRTFALHLTVRHLIPDPTGEGAGQIGIDVGIAVALATSDGEHIHLPQRLHQMRREIVRWQRLKAKRRQGSRGWSEAKNTIAALSRLLAARKKQFMRDIALEHCRANTLIGLEDLNNQAMRKSAAGTRRKPGRNVAAKRGLNRELAFLAPGLIVAAYKRAAIKTGTRIVLVDYKDSSKECSACGKVTKGNREIQSVFVCKRPLCGHSENADINAARNILARAIDQVAKARLAADTRNKKSAAGSGQSASRTAPPFLRTASGQRQLSEAGNGAGEQHRLAEPSPL